MGRETHLGPGKPASSAGAEERGNLKTGQRKCFCMQNVGGAGMAVHLRARTARGCYFGAEVSRRTAGALGLEICGEI